MLLLPTCAGEGRYSNDLQQSLFQLSYHPYRVRLIWVRPVRAAAWWDHFTNEVVVREEW